MEKITQTPSNPENSETPEDPSNPENPSNPETPSNPENPSNPETPGTNSGTFTIYFKNIASYENVFIYMWHMNGEQTTKLTENWPGTAMTPVEGSANWYSYTIDLATSEGVQLIFNNGLENGAQQSSDLNFSSSKLYWANDVAFATKEEAEAAKTQSVTVYYKNTRGWETPHTHAWNTSSHINSWPGVPMTKVEGTEDWYSYTYVSGSLDGFAYMFTDGVADSGNKTANITYNPDKLYYSHGVSYATMAEADSSTVLYSDWYFMSDANGWQFVDILAIDENGNAYIVYTVTTTDGIKIATSGWAKELNYSHADQFLCNGEGTNNFYMKTAGTYKFIVTASGELLIEPA